MCESTVFIEKDGERAEFMSDVVKIVFESDKAVCFDILGEKKVLKNARLKEANLVKHAILFEIKE